MGEQLRMPDASAQWAAVLARLRESVRSVARRPPPGWRVWGSWCAREAGGPFEGSRSGPYLCHRLTRGKESLDLWYVAAAEPLSHELVAATCGGVARVLGCEPERVVQFVYQGAVSA